MTKFVKKKASLEGQSTFFLSFCLIDTEECALLHLIFKRWKRGEGGSSISLGIGIILAASVLGLMARKKSFLEVERRKRRLQSCLAVAAWGIQCIRNNCSRRRRKRRRRRRRRRKNTPRWLNRLSQKDLESGATCG